MAAVAYVIITLVSVVLYALQIAMFLRAVMSWLPGLDDTKFADFLYTVTEPVITPVRLFFERMNWFSNSPLDVSFFVTYILLAVISAILGMLA